jgi:hypothetical protein
MPWQGSAVRFTFLVGYGLTIADSNFSVIRPSSGRLSAPSGVNSRVQTSLEGAGRECRPSIYRETVKASL